MKEMFKKVVTEFGSIIAASWLFFDILLKIEAGEVLHQGGSTVIFIVILLICARTTWVAVCEIGRLIHQKYTEIWKEERDNICICETRLDDEK